MGGSKINLLLWKKREKSSSNLFHHSLLTYYYWRICFLVEATLNGNLTCYNFPFKQFLLSFFPKWWKLGMICLLQERQDTWNFSLIYSSQANQVAAAYLRCAEHENLLFLWIFNLNNQKMWCIYRILITWPRCLFECIHKCCIKCHPYAWKIFKFGNFIRQMGGPLIKV